MKTARVLAAAAVLVASVAGVVADSNPVTNDVDLLNYALQLEDLELSFYTKGLAQYSNTDFTNAGVPTAVRDYMILIQSHEQAHVNFLTTVITGASPFYASTAQPNCTAYAFTANGFNSVADFVSQAITLEDVGVSAYTGALNTITNEVVQQAAATIATVEARHAAYLRSAAGNSTTMTKVPFPEPTNTARTPAQVISVAGPYFTNCPYTIIQPTIRPAGVMTGTTLSAAVATSATPSSPAPVYTQKQFNDDVATLNYALTLEYLEANFYNTFAGKFSASDLESATGMASGQGATILSNLALVQAHENAHVSALQGLISNRQMTAVTAGCYDWSSISSATDFLTVAAKLENTGVSAYDGAANNITDTSLQQIAASVAVVEARHAAYLNVLIKQSPSELSFMNGNFDQAYTRGFVASTVSSLPYVKALNGGCPSSSSSSSTGRPNAASSLAAPAMMLSAALAFVAALLF